MSSIHRRKYLSTIAAGVVGGVAGCTSLNPISESGGGGIGNGSGGTWTSLHGDPGNTGTNLKTTGPTSKPTRKKFHETGNLNSFSSLPVTDGSTIAARSSESLFGLSPDGTEQWKYSVGASMIGPWAPAIHDTAIYTATAQGNLLAIKDGKRAWAANPPTSDLTPPISNSEGIYVAGEQTVIMYDHEGKKQWTAETTGRRETSRPAVAGDRLVHFTTAPHKPWEDPKFRIICRSVTDGSVIWERSDGAGGPAPVVANGTLYTYQDGIKVVALSLSDGSTQWKSDSLGPGGDLIPTVADDAVYVPLAEELHALDTADGSAIWDQPYTYLNTPVFSPRTDGQTVYQILKNSTVAVNAQTGNQRWSISTNNFSFGGASNIALFGGSLYLARTALQALE